MSAPERENLPTDRTARPYRLWCSARSEWAVIAVVFLVAFALRLAYVMQVSSAPYFDDPLGDSLIYYERARQILAGRSPGDEIYFHSSPVYPYFIALVLRLSGGSLVALGVVQALVGAGNCVLVYLLAKRLGGRAAAALAGLAAAFYGLLAFFDGDLLMIFLTLFFVDLALLLLVRARGSGRLRWPLAAGVSLGLAALDKTNLLLFAPVAAWWLAGDYSLSWREWRWKPPLLLAAGVSLVVLPVTTRNYLVAHDLVLVSSNAGVNLFIGNNPDARGFFHLPEDSGLANTDLYGSSVKVAEASLARKLKPSEVSEFWAAKARRFLREQPLAEAKLLGRKSLLLLNAYEIPNHLDFYNVRWKYAPVLWVMVVGFWLVAPVALVAIAWRSWAGLGPVGSLYLGFLASYAASLLPFFICERYRLPMVPVFIAFAAVLTAELYRWARAAAYRPLVAAAAGLAAAGLLVNWPFTKKENFLLIGREALAGKHLERARKDPDTHRDDIAEAIRELKQVLEVDPSSTVARVNLGSAYGMAGFYSGAIWQYEQALKHDPGRTEVRRALEYARNELARRGDLNGTDVIPASPFEQAEAFEAAGQMDRAARLYTEILERDPFHFNAVSNLGAISFRRGEPEEAARIFERGLERQPSNFGLLYNLAHVNFHMGRLVRARELWSRCLQLQPDNALVQEQLSRIPGSN